MTSLSFIFMFFIQALNFRTVLCHYMSVSPLSYPLYSLSCSESFIQLPIPGSFCVCMHSCFYVFAFHCVCFSLIEYLCPQSIYSIWGHFGIWTWENRRQKKPHNTQALVFCSFTQNHAILGQIMIQPHGSNEC
jgi:hypothetical protein